MGIMKSDEIKIRSDLKESKISICVIGMGRIGLPTATMFAEAGCKVKGVDIDEDVVKLTNSGRCRFVDEPGLDVMVRHMVQAGYLEATSEISPAISVADVIIICVPTPVDDTKIPSYSAVVKVCHDIGNNIKRDSLVIFESTVGPGTVEDLAIPILENLSGLKAGKDFGVASCPERSDPGNIVRNMRSVPRIVGGIDRRSANVVATLYEAAFGVKVVAVSNPKTANAVKLTENLFRDVNIALANELALLYERLRIDTIEVINACATKYNFMPHYPGAGVGGPCLPANPYYLIVEGVKVGNIPYLIRMAREINDRMPEHTVTLVLEGLNDVGKTVRGAKLAILGVSYKPDIKDLQLTPIEKICISLVQMGGKISIYDPYFKGEEVFGFKVESSLEQAIRNVDCIIIGTAHKELMNLNLSLLQKLCNNPAALVDTRHILDPGDVRKSGFAYRGVGRN